MKTRVNFIKKTVITLLLLMGSFTLYAGDFEDYRIALKLFDDGFYDSALNSFNRFILNYPKSKFNKNAIYFSGLALIKTGKLRDAIVTLKPLTEIKKFEYESDLYYNLIVLTSMVGLADESELLLSQSGKIVFDENQTEVISYYSITNKYKLNQLELAESASLEYLKHKNYRLFRVPILKMLHNNLANIKDDEKLLRYINEILKENLFKNEEQIILERNRIRALYNLAQFDKITSEVNNITKKNDHESIKYAAYSLYNTGKFQDARELLYASLGVKKAQREMTEFITDTLIADSKYNDAIKILKESGDKKYFKRLGELYYKISDYKSALKYFKQANLKTLDTQAFLCAFISADKTANPSTIIELSKYSNRFSDYEPELKNYLYYKTGETLYNRKNYDSSLIFLTEWSKLFSGSERSDSVNYIIAMILKSKKKYSEAINYLAEIEKMNKKDKLYYESFAEKGELYFYLWEYGSAIRNFEVYLRQDVSDERKSFVLLQSGNAHFNIKDFEKALKLYQEYYAKYGELNNITEKISLCFLRTDRYTDIISFIKSKKTRSLTEKYYLAFAFFKTNDLESAAAMTSANIEEYRTIYEPFYTENLSLFLKTTIAIENNNEIIKNFDKHKKNIQLLDNTQINGEFFRFFLKFKDTKRADEVFRNSLTREIVYIKHDAYKRINDFNNAVKYADLISDYPLNDLSASQIISIIDTYTYSDNYKKAIDILIKAKGSIQSEIFDSKFVLAVHRERDFEYLNSPLINEQIKKYSLLDNYFNLYSTDIRQYKKTLEDFIREKQLTDKNILEALTQLVRIHYESKEYNAVLNLFSSIPQNARINLSSELLYYEGLSKIETGMIEEAITDLIKIHYAYPTDVYMVYQAFNRLFTLYTTQGETDKLEKLRTLFESKYYKL